MLLSSRIWLCIVVLHNTTQNISDNFPSYPQTIIIAQVLSNGGETGLATAITKYWRTWMLFSGGFSLGLAFHCPLLFDSGVLRILSWRGFIKVRRAALWVGRVLGYGLAAPPHQLGCLRKYCKLPSGVRGGSIIPGRPAVLLYFKWTRWESPAVLLQGLSALGSYV